MRALIYIAANPVLSTPKGPRPSRALDGLDFMLSLDIHLNETSLHADAILPGLSPLEDLHFDIAVPQLSFRNPARFSGPVFAKPAEQPEEWETLLRLTAMVEGRNWRADVDDVDDVDDVADVAELDGAAFNGGLRGPERLIDLALRSGPYGGTTEQDLTLAKLKAADGGIELGPLQPRIPELPRTPSGRIELAPPSLLADLQNVDTALSLPAPEFSLIGRRDLRSGNSWMHNLALLAKGPQRCTLLINPLDAQRLGLNDGGQALLGTELGELRVQVALSGDMSAGVVSLPHGWRHDLAGVRRKVASARPGANLNALLDDSLRDPPSGNAVLGGVAVRLSTAPEERN